MTYKAVFLDRDGVINEDKGYVFRHEDLVILPGVKNGLKILKEHGFKLIVVTNQSGVARGLFTEEDVFSFHQYLNEILGDKAAIDAFYYCPHHKDAVIDRYRSESPDRKPGTGMLEKAANDIGVNKSESYMIGDKASDYECALRFGVTPFQMKTRYELHPQALQAYKKFMDVVNLIVS